MLRTVGMFGDRMHVVHADTRGPVIVGPGAPPLSYHVQPHCTTISTGELPHP